MTPDSSPLESGARVPSPTQARSEQWLAWMDAVRGKLLRTSGSGAFFSHHWAAHAPKVFPVQPLPALDWTSQSLRRGAAGPLEVEVQTGRLSDGDYEVRSNHHKTRMPFSQFIDLVENGPANDVYMTANNSAANSALLETLSSDLLPLPPVLRPDPTHGFLWIGRDTVTPMHHDLTQNLVIQLVGTKMVRLVSPVEQPKLGNTLHVYADFHWLDDDLAAARDIASTDVELTPGTAMFIPVGWWHCVRATGFSVTYTSHNFLWPNYWVEGFS